MGSTKARAPTPAETLARQQARPLMCRAPDRGTPAGRSIPGAYGQTPPAFEQWGSSFEDELLLDGPVLGTLLPNLVANDPEAAVRLIAPSIVPAGPVAEAYTDKLLDNFIQSTIGLGNLPGNVYASTEASLRQAWRIQARRGFGALLSGQVTRIELAPGITLTSNRINAQGVAGRGARITARIANVPIEVMQQFHGLPGYRASVNAGGGGVLKVSARNMAAHDQMFTALSHSKFEANKWLRFGSSRLGGGILTFGPSAVIDLVDTVKTNGSVKDFAVRSAKSQSGNIVGAAAGWGAGVTAVALFGAAGITIAGAPVVLIGLGAGILAQVAWGALGYDEEAAKAAQNLLR